MSDCNMSPSVPDLSPSASDQPVSASKNSLTAYPPGPFTPAFLVGGNGGSEFSTCGWVQDQKALVVKKLQVWWDDGTIKAVQVVYFDDSVSSIFGHEGGSTATITFAPGERVATLILWGNGVGTRCGRIRILTNKGQDFNHGKDVSGQTAYTAPVGSGIMVGMVGRCGNAVDQLGAVFLGGSLVGIAIKVEDATYSPNLAGKTTGLSAVALQRTHFSGGKTYDFHGDTTRTVSQTFTQTSSTTFGASVSATVSAKPFGIGGSVTTGFSWESMKSTESAAMTSTDISMGWGVTGDIPEGKGVTCTAFTEMGTGVARYNSTVTILLWDGSTTTYSEPGIFENVVYTETWVKTVDDTLKGKPGVPIETPPHQSEL